MFFYFVTNQNRAGGEIVVFANLAKGEARLGFLWMPIKLEEGESSSLRALI